MSEKIADELHAFIAAAPHKYPGHLIELFDRAEKALRRRSAVSAQPSFQKRVHGWMMDCFSMEICRDRQERNHRFLEEALELVQACGCTASEAHQLVDYVYGRDQGDINQEVGGVMVTLAALCLANDIDMHQGGEIELARILQPAIMNKIRAKQAAKPKHSPLPAHPAPGAGAEPQTAPELTATCQKLLPGGIVDDATYAEIEDALDRAEAPSIVGGRWLKLHERIAALTAERTAASAEPQSQAEIAAIDLIAWLEADGMLSEHAKRLAPRFLSKFNVTRKSRAQAESVDGK